MKISLVPHVVPHLTVEDGQEELAICRLMRTYHQFDPGHPHELILNCCDHPGRDIAAHQHIARTLDCDLAVFMSARVFFHRAFWLSRLVDACRASRADFYGIMGSMEACPLFPNHFPNPHIRTCFFACKPHLIADAPKAQIPGDGFFFESHWIPNISGRKSVLVHWDKSYSLEYCRKSTNGFRQGDQSELLAHDRHSLIYENSSPEEKLMLNRIANGEKL